MSKILSFILLFITNSAISQVIFNSTTVAADNSFIDIEFTAPVDRDVSTASLSAIRIDNELLYSFFDPDGTVSVSVVSLTDQLGNPLVGGETIIRANLGISGSPDGNETIDFFPADGASIFDSDAGTAMLDGETVTAFLNAEGVAILSSLGASASISSLNTNSPGTVVFSFTIDNTAGSQTLRFQSLNFLEGLSDEVADWTTVIAGAELYDDRGNGPGSYAGVNINPDQLLFSDIQNNSPNSMGRIQNGEVRTYFLEIWLSNPLPDGVDGQAISFILDPTQVVTISSSLNPSNIIFSDEFNEFNLIDVTQTQFRVIQDPEAVALAGLPVTQAFIVGATDANGNIDLDYNDPISVSNPGGIPMQNLPLASGGIIDFTNLIYEGTGDGTLTVDDGSNSVTSTGVTVECPAKGVNIVAVGSNINCDVPNGEIQVDIDGSTDLGIYSVEWFESGPPATPIGTNDFTISGLAAGIYNVRITEDATGCFYELTSISIIDDIIPPNLNIVATENTECLPNYNGELTVSVTNLTGVFDYQFTGPQIGTISNGGTTEIITGLEPGAYDITVLDIATGCSTIQSATVSDNSSNINITIANSGDNTSCSSPNGFLDLLVSGGSGTYDYDVTGAVSNNYTALAQGTSALFENLEPDTYTITVSDVSLSCSASTSFTINESLPTIEIIDAVVSDQTYCDPVNGSAEIINVTIDAVSSPISNFTFEWTDQSSNVISTSPSVSNLSAGNYSVIATNTVSGCPSLPFSVIIDDLTSTSVPAVLTTVVDNTSCDPANANGQLLINVTPIGSYTYDITGPQGVLPSSATQSGLPSGTYNITVTDNISGCSATDQEIIGDNSILPSVSISATNNQTNCITPDGSSSLDLTYDGIPVSDFTDYTLEWFNSSDNSFVGSGQTITGLTSGSYYVVANKLSTGCSSGQVPVTIADDTPQFTLGVTPSDNTSCDALNPDGSLSITVNVTSGSATTFTYELVSTTSGPVDLLSGQGTTAAFTSIANDTYDIIVTEESSGCSNTIQSTVLPGQLLPVLLPASSTADQTSCTSPDGLAEVELYFDGNLVTDYSDYSIEWFSSADNSSLGSGPSLANLAASSVYAQATKTSTSCVSDPLTIVIIDATPQLIASLTPTPNTSCDPNTSNGALNVAVTGGGTTFTYELNSTTSGLLTTLTNQSANIDFTDLPAGSYEVVVTDENSGCVETSLASTILDQPATPTLESTVTSNTACDGTPNGSADILVDGSADATGLTISWFEGIDNSGTPLSTITGLSASGLAAGSYYVEVLTVEGCSAGTSISIADETTVPTIIIQTQANTSCQSSNGAASITVNGGTDLAGFTVNWYVGTDNTGTLVDSNVLEITSLEGGEYTVQVVNNSNNCFSTNTFTIVESAEIPTISLISKSDNTTCDTPNGSAAITINGSTDVSQFTVSWTDSGGNEIATNVSSVSGLAADTYSVEATTNGTDCRSTLAIEILESLSIPSNAEIVGGGTICEGGSGEIQVNITGGTGPFEIEIDNEVGLISTYNSGDPIPVSPSGNTIYKILNVTDASGCAASAISTAGAEFRVNPLPDPPSNLTFSNVTETSMRIAWDSGTGAGRLVIVKEGAAVDAAPEAGTSYAANSVFGRGADLGGGSFVVFNGLGTSVNITGLTEGIEYFFEVYETNGLCYSATSATASQETAGCQPPDITADPLTQTICSGSTSLVTMTSTDPDATFNWTVAAGSVTGASDGTGSTIEQTLSGNGTVTYTITPVSGSCEGISTIVEVVVQDAPTSFEVTGGGIICEGTSDVLPIGLSGSQSGVEYVLYRGSSIVETVSGTGSALQFTPTDIQGDYTVSASTIGASCEGEMNGTVNVAVSPAPTLGGSITGDTEVCQGETGLTFSVNDIGNVTYNWSLPTGFSIASGEGTNQINVDISEDAPAGDISVTAENPCGITAPLTLSINVKQGFTAEIVSEPELFAGRNASFSISTTESLNSVVWDFGNSDLANSETASTVYNESGTYTVTADLETSAGCTKLISTTVEVGELAKVIIKNIYTLNGDGYNDLLWIDNISLYPDNEVVILDRWGVPVAEFNNYGNDWDFRNEGDYIPAGNYLVMVKIPNDEEVYSMTINVIRR